MPEIHPRLSDFIALKSFNPQKNSGNISGAAAPVSQSLANCDVFCRAQLFRKKTAVAFALYHLTELYHVPQKRKSRASLFGQTRL
jgi:hypothetical protein